MEESKKEEEIKKDKSNYDILIQELFEYGYTKDNLISQSEIILFLERKSPENKFNNNLKEKLFKVLNIKEFSVVTISQFISGFIKLDEELRKKRVELNEEYLNKKKLYENIINMCKRYQSEKVNKEGFSENAKLRGEIIDSNFNIDLEGVQEIIVKIIYGGQEQEIKKNIRINQKENEINKKFEFKAYSKKDYLQFVLMTKNYLNYVAEIGSKTYSIEGIINQDPFFVKIEIPFEENEFENEDNFAAIIKAKLLLRWSDFRYYEKQKKKEGQNLKKIETDIEEIEDNIINIEYILSEKGLEKEEEEVKEKNKEGLLKKTVEFNKYIVDFNNERIDNIIDKGIKVDYNNEKEIKENNEEKNCEKQEIINNQNIEEYSNYNINTNINNIINNDYYNDENKENNIIQENNNIINVDKIVENSNVNEQKEEINYENMMNINNEQNYTSYNNALLTESTKKTLIQENILPLKYLPQKVNKVIIDNNVSTLPLIDVGKKITYFTSQENINSDIYH